MSRRGGEEGLDPLVVGEAPEGRPVVAGPRARGGRPRGARGSRRRGGRRVRVGGGVGERGDGGRVAWRGGARARVQLRGPRCRSPSLLPPRRPGAHLRRSDRLQRGARHVGLNVYIQ